MSFECNNCGKEVSGSSMAGLVLGQIAKNKLEQNGIKSFSQSGLTQSFNSGEFSASFVSGLGIKCPKCEKSDWK